MHRDNVPCDDLPKEVAQMIPSNRSSTVSGFLFQEEKVLELLRGRFLLAAFHPILLCSAANLYCLLSRARAAPSSFPDHHLSIQVDDFYREISRQQVPVRARYNLFSVEEIKDLQAHEARSLRHR
jgi:hypothetical protein